MRRQTMSTDLLAFARAAGTIENASPARRFLADAATLPPENCYVACFIGAIRLSHRSVEPEEIA